MKSIVIVMSCSITILLNLMMVGCRMLPEEYKDLYDYTAALEIAEKELDKFVQESGYASYEIISVDKIAYFGELQKPKSRIVFSELSGAVVIVFEVILTTYDTTEGEKTHYGVGLYAKHNELSIIDTGNHIDTINVYFAS